MVSFKLIALSAFKLIAATSLSFAIIGYLFGHPFWVGITGLALSVGFITGNTIGVMAMHRATMGLLHAEMEKIKAIDIPAAPLRVQT